MKNSIATITFVYSILSAYAYDIVHGFAPYQNHDTWVSEMRDYSSDIRKSTPQLARYTTQCYVSYDSQSPSYFYITRNNISDCCLAYKNNSGAKILVVTQTTSDGIKNIPYQNSRRGGSSYSTVRESMDAFDALCSKLGIVNYVYNNINIQNLYDIDTSSIGLTEKPVFGIFRLPSNSDEYNRITDWKSYLRSHCITNRYPQSFTDGNWDQSWKDLTDIVSDVFASEIASNNTEAISGATSSAAYQSYLIHPENTIARFNVSVLDLLVKCQTSESDNDAVKQLEMLGGSVFVDQDDRICMKESPSYGTPMMRFVASKTGYLQVMSEYLPFTASMTISGTNKVSSTSALQVHMHSGDSVTFTGESFFVVFEFE